MLKKRNIIEWYDRRYDNNSFFIFIFFIYEIIRQALIIYKTKGLVFLNKNTPLIPIYKKKSLSILASGASINLLNTRDWNEIKKSTTVGLNYWFYSNKKPDIYVFELPPDSRTAEIFVKNMLIKFNKDKNYTNLIVKDVNFGRNFTKCIKAFNKNSIQLHAPILISLRGKSRSTFAKELKLINFLRTRFYLPIFFQKRATISFCLDFAEFFDFRNTTMFGVDLNNVEYFYEKSSEIDGDLELLPTGQEDQKIHYTMNKSVFPYGIDCIILDQIEFAEKRKGYRQNVLIGSCTSALYPRLQLWSSNK